MGRFSLADLLIPTYNWKLRLSMPVWEVPDRTSSARMLRLDVASIMQMQLNMKK